MIPVGTEDLKAWAFRTCNHAVQQQRRPIVVSSRRRLFGFYGCKRHQETVRNLNASSNPRRPTQQTHDPVVADVHDSFCQCGGPASARSPYCSLTQKGFCPRARRRDSRNSRKDCFMKRLLIGAVIVGGIAGQLAAQPNSPGSVLVISAGGAELLLGSPKLSRWDNPSCGRPAGRNGDKGFGYWGYACDPLYADNNGTAIPRRVSLLRYRR